MRVPLAITSALLARGLLVEPEPWRTDDGHAVAHAEGQRDLAAQLDATVMNALASAERRQLGCPLTAATMIHQHNCSHFTSDEICAKRRSELTWLATYPGSGNTWTRAVLQSTTQIHTGAAHYDETLRAVGFEGEGDVNPMDVLVVKTHHPYYADVAIRQPEGSDRALVVVRHPLPAALAFLQFKITGDSHSAETPYDELRYMFDDQRAKLLQGWAELMRFWINHQGEKSFVRFDAIIADPIGMYSKVILPFLGLRSDDYDSQLSCALSAASKNALLHRNHTYKFAFNSDDAAAAKLAAGAEMTYFGFQ